MKNKSFFMIIAILIIALSSFAQESGTYTDTRDGKTYKTVKIGTQTWMAENLAFKAEDGCWAYDNDVNNVAIYGYLYDWETAMAICPKGWHLPKRAELENLILYLGGEEIAGGKLKATTTWANPNTDASNSSGFTALPGGVLIFQGQGTFKDVGTRGGWWSSTTFEGEDESDEYDAYIMYTFYNVSKALLEIDDKICAYSVRCMKD